jgi:hypothetical protein
MPKGKTGKAACAVALRRQAVLDGRLAGKTLRVIATELGISKTSAHRDIQAALADLDDDISRQAETYRRLEDARIERLLTAVWPRAMTGDLKANERAHRLIEAQVRLHGLAAPVRISPTIPDGSPGGIGLAALLFETDA